MITIYLIDRQRGVVDITAYVDITSVNITDSIKVKADSLHFTMKIKGWETRKPLAGNNIKIVSNLLKYPHASSEGFATRVYEEIEFWGQIMTVTQTMINPVTFQYEVECQDWTHWFDRHLVTLDIEAGRTTREIIGMLDDDTILGAGPNRYSNEASIEPIFTTDNVVEIADCPAFQWKNVEPSQAMDELAEAIGCQWYIDYEKDVHFNYPHKLFEGANTPVTTASGAIVIDADNDNLVYGDLVITEDFTQLRNRVIVAEAKEAAPTMTTDSFTTDWETKYFFALTRDAFCPDNPGSAELNTLMRGWIKNRVDGAIERTLNDVKVDYKEGRFGDGKGGANTIYWNPEMNSIRLPDNFPLQYYYGTPGTVVVGTQAVLEIQYYAAEEFEDVVFSRDSVEEVRDREGRISSGQYEIKVSEAQIYDRTDREQIMQAANRALLRYGQPAVNGSFYSMLPGWKAGQKVVISSVVRGEKENPFVVEAYVQSVKRTYPSGEWVRSEVDFSNTPWGN